MHQRLEPEVNLALALEHGLTEREYRHVCERLGRPPTYTELGVVSVMWSEHCSYKSTKRLLGGLFTQAPWVLQGPGENAGAVDIGNGEAIVFKIESHNHPSAVEPFQGATTGVGGILRDIFTMGARPIAMLNSLRFGDLRKAAVKRLAQGVVHGIGSYGNCVGVPTVGGEMYSDPCYEGNPLVNAMCVGFIQIEKLTKAIARTPGALVIYYGNATGRDGVHGCTFASEELTEETMQQRSAVQVGDPFMGKRILEATLDLIQASVMEAIQDMGAAGLTCSSCEMGGRGGLGINLDLDKVPRRTEGLSAYELMLSESQERMLAVCREENLADAQRILGRWGLEAHVVGVVTAEDRLVVTHAGAVVASLPNSLLSTDAPVYDHQAVRPSYLDTLPTLDLTPEMNTGEELREAALKLLAHPSVASKRWVYDLYDSQVRGNTVQGPGGGAAVIRVGKKQIALATKCNAMLCYLNPRIGAQMAVAEAARSLACVGARPLGITNNQNGGNPNKSGAFWQLKEAIGGMDEAARALEIPTTGGNVSLYNETPQSAVFPTPVIGMVGIVEDPTKLVTPHFHREGLALLMLGAGSQGVGGSHYAMLQAGKPVGPCPEIDLQAEVRLQTLLRELIKKGLVVNARNISEGGLAMAVIKAALGGTTGFKLGNFPEGWAAAAGWLFGEAPSRVLITVKEGDLDAVIATEAVLFDEPELVPITGIGMLGGDDLVFGNLFTLTRQEAAAAYYGEDEPLLKPIEAPYVARRPITRMRITAGVTIFPGSNCDQDMIEAMERIMGWKVYRLWHQEAALPPDLDVIGLPGGFSYGDYLRVGALAARSPVMRSVSEFAARGGHVLGVCNGFQILTAAGLLPGTLGRNHSLQFHCRDVALRVERPGTVFTDFAEPVIRLPIAHGQGAYFNTPDGLRALEDNGQILFSYCDLTGNPVAAWNPNGSIRNIAGICNVAGNVMGMMPHPERACEAILGGEDGRFILDSIGRGVRS